MFSSYKRSAAVLASAAVLSMAATPALARDRGWGGGWGKHYGRHHGDGVSAGDVLAGVLIIGGIAAIASAASKSKKDREAQDGTNDYRYPGRYPGQQDDAVRDNSPRYGNSGADDRPEWREGTGINGAVDRCLEEVERGSNRVDGVDSVNREGEGWRVAGRTGNGQDFACTVGTDGRIRSASIDGRAI